MIINPKTGRHFALFEFWNLLLIRKCPCIVFQQQTCFGNILTCKHLNIQQVEQVFVCSNQSKLTARFCVSELQTIGPGCLTRRHGQLQPPGYKVFTERRCITVTVHCSALHCNKDQCSFPKLIYHRCFNWHLWLTGCLSI